MSFLDTPAAFVRKDLLEEASYKLNFLLGFGSVFLTLLFLTFVSNFVGPAIAVFWGWLPALLWVVFGSIFIGAVHDFWALMVSLRNRGQTGRLAFALSTPTPAARPCAGYRDSARGRRGS